MGYSEEEQKKPRIAVVNSWNEYNPGHVHLNRLAERVNAWSEIVGILTALLTAVFVSMGVVSRLCS